jgi:CcmD family protein
MRLFPLAIVVLMMTGSLLPRLPLPVFADAIVAAQAPTRPAPQDEYVPIDQLPPQEELPAAPMVVAAYSFVWVAFVAYLFTLLKRLRKIETDLAVLERGGH